MMQVTKVWWDGEKLMAEPIDPTTIYQEPAQQEPVAWMYPDDHERMLTNETFCTVYSVEVGSATRGESTVPLYTSPPAQRTWVGLTDVEWMNIVNKDQAWFGQRPDEVAHEVAKLVESKLKEKNNG